MNTDTLFDFLNFSTRFNIYSEGFPALGHCSKMKFSTYPKVTLIMILSCLIDLWRVLLIFIFGVQRSISQV